MISPNIVKNTVVYGSMAVGFYFLYAKFKGYSLKDANGLPFNVINGLKNIPNKNHSNSEPIPEPEELGKTEILDSNSKVIKLQ